MRIICFLILLLSCVALNAQTRRIAHRSHGGSNHERYDNADGNYGIPMYLTKPRMPVSEVTWVADTINGVVTWRLDTLRRTVNNLTPVNSGFRRYVISDVRDFGNVCTKATKK